MPSYQTPRLFGPLESANPYLDEFVASRDSNDPVDLLYGRFRLKLEGTHRDSLPDVSFPTSLLDSFDNGSRGNSLRGLMDREAMVEHFAFSVPDEEALAKLAALGPLVEVFAGTGYWARLLRERGVDILAYDMAVDTVSDDQRGLGQPIKHLWTEVIQQDAVEAAALHPDRTLLMGWPVRDGTAGRALQAYMDAGGQTVALIADRGCCGDDVFYRLLSVYFEATDDYQIPTWSAINDRMTIYARREKRRTYATVRELSAILSSGDTEALAALTRAKIITPRCFADAFRATGLTSLPPSEPQQDRDKVKRKRARKQ
jgi:hypothetical protein